MRKTFIAIFVVIILFQIAGFTITRMTVKNAVNTRLDASEAVLVNEISGKLQRDFSMNIQPSQVMYTDNSFEYINGENETVVLYNSTENDVMIHISRSDGDVWTGTMRGQIEVQNVDHVFIPSQGIQVDLRRTGSKLYAVTFRVSENIQKGRTSLNREFTIYLSLTEVM